MGSASGHAYGVQFAADRRFLATCSCGWESAPVTTAGLASAMWDDHYVEVARQPPEPRRHQIEDVEAAGGVYGGYRLLCTCGWRSNLIPQTAGVGDVYRRHLQTT